MISVFLPIRKNSQRVLNKNTRTFAGVEGGLTRIKLDQLIQVELINKIYVSTDCELSIRIAKKINSNKIVIDNRPKEFCLSTTTTDSLIVYASSIIPNGTIIWTHVTSPLFHEKLYEASINTYFQNIKKYDSLMTITKHRGFFYDDHKPINFNRKNIKWPFTQEIMPINEVNSALFIANKDIYQKYNDRIGINPLLYETDRIDSFDIDWIDDFKIAEILYNRNERKKTN